MTQAASPRAGQPVGLQTGMRLEHRADLGDPIIRQTDRQRGEATTVNGDSAAPSQMPITRHAAGGSLAEPGLSCRDVLRMVRTGSFMNNLCCWLVTCRPGNSVLGTVVEKPIWLRTTPRPADAGQSLQQPSVAGRTGRRLGVAQLSASPTGRHPPMSPTGHQSCRGRPWPSPSQYVRAGHVRWS